MAIEFDERKMRELILYVADQCESDPDFGAVKMNKILFYADFLAYGNTGKPITGAEYRKLPLGPVPDLRSLLQSMAQDGEIVIKHRNKFGYVQNRVVPLRDPDLSFFSGVEIALVNSVITALMGLNASAVSSLSHLEHGWKFAESYESIPYPTVFLSNEPVTDADRERVAVLVAKHGEDW